MAGRCGRIVNRRPCKAPAVGKSGYCIFHGPSREAKIRKAKRIGKRVAKTAIRYDVDRRVMRAYRTYRRRR